MNPGEAAGAELPPAYPGSLLSVSALRLRNGAWKGGQGHGDTRAGVGPEKAAAGPSGAAADGCGWVSVSAQTGAGSVPGA